MDIYVIININFNNHRQFMLSFINLSIMLCRVVSSSLTVFVVVFVINPLTISHNCIIIMIHLKNICNYNNKQTKTYKTYNSMLYEVKNCVSIL